MSTDKGIRMSKGPLAIENEDEDLKKSLGEKYSDYKPMVDEVKKNLKRVADMIQKAYPLDLRIQHPYSYRYMINLTSDSLTYHLFLP